jgi:predicted ribosome quality control (RQC) complex YloA/Tae2 family protein
VPVDITTRRHVRKIRGAPPGQVTYTGERTILVAPSLPVTRTETRSGEPRTN